MNNISMHMLDIVQNSIRANATQIEISICENTVKNYLEFLIIDNGAGMEKTILEHVTDPYTTTRTTRKVGMGLPLLKQSAEQSNGYIKVCSEKEVGTTVQAIFQFDHIDRPPLGDCTGTIVLLVAANPEIDFKYIHYRNSKMYVFDTKEIKEVLGDIKINDPRVRGMLKEMISENIQEIYV